MKNADIEPSSILPSASDHLTFTEKFASNITNTEYLVYLIHSLSVHCLSLDVWWSMVCQSELGAKD